MARIVRRKERPPEKPPVDPVVPPAPDIPSVVTPAGTIITAMPWGAKAEASWETITAYDALVHAAADPVGWPIERIRGTIVIESQGNPKAVQKNDRNGWSYGLMQVVPYGVGWGGWNALVKEKAGLTKGASREQVVAALYDPRINIAVGVAILEGFYVQHGTLDRASSAFFLGNPNWVGADSVNGNTGSGYQRSLNGLITEQRGTRPPPPTQRSLISTVMGGKPFTIISEFGVASGNGLYGYGRGHGLNGSQHTGIDIGGEPGSALYSPVDGTVVCAGTGVGAGDHNSSCAAFGDYYGHKAGRVEVMTHDGAASLIFGHSSESTVRVGQTVTIGQQVATMGGMNSWHCHLEARTWSGGDYMIRDPRAVFAGGTTDTFYAERVPVPQPSAWEKGATVTITRDGVPLLQRADADAAEVDSPWKRGDTFEAVQLVYNPDEKKWYWMSKASTRVPISGTSSELLGDKE
jgi:murein DD-endopeptidase MepM/ murein hydrolase activator NlpD